MTLIKLLLYESDFYNIHIISLFVSREYRIASLNEVSVLSQQSACIRKQGGAKLMILARVSIGSAINSKADCLKCGGDMKINSLSYQLKLSISIEKCHIIRKRILQNARRSSQHISNVNENS